MMQILCDDCYFARDINDQSLAFSIKDKNFKKFPSIKVENCIIKSSHGPQLICGRLHATCHEHGSNLLPTHTVHRNHFNLFELLLQYSSSPHIDPLTIARDVCRFRRPHRGSTTLRRPICLRSHSQECIPISVAAPSPEGEGALLRPSRLRCEARHLRWERGRSRGSITQGDLYVRKR